MKAREAVTLSLCLPFVAAEALKHGEDWDFPVHSLLLAQQCCWQLGLWHSSPDTGGDEK